jgi:hypothetical protein
MADIFAISPRRTEARIRLHAGELASIVVQDDILRAFTEEELTNIHQAVGIELQDRPHRNSSKGE